MNFAHPLALLLLLGLIPVALLYWLRVRVPGRTVGTGLFWQKALAEEKVRQRWQRWRPKVSLAVQVLLVVLIALAAAGPQIPPPKRIVLIIDNSATMRATDVQPTRIDAAKDIARRLVESQRSCDEMAVVMVSPEPIEVQPPTSDRALLAAVIKPLPAMAVPATIERAVKLAREIPALGEDRLKPGLRAQVPPRIVLITDACDKEATKRAEQSGVDVLRVGTAAGNLAITCFTARRSKAEPVKCEALVQVRNQGNQSAQGSVTVSVDEKSEKLPSPARRGAGGAATAQFSIAKNSAWQHVFTLDLPAAARLTAKLEPGDAYIFDDMAVLDVPAAPAMHRVKFTGEERSCLKEILGATHRVELIRDDTEAKAIQVIDGKTPQTLPAGPLLIFTPAACDLWQLGEAVADPLVTGVDLNSPIMAGVRLFDAYLPEARQLQLAESLRSVARPFLWAGATPLGYAIDRPQGRVVVIGGDLATSNLPLQAALPQLVAQALDWLDGQSPWKDELLSPNLPYSGQQVASSSEGGLAAIYRSLMVADSHAIAPRPSMNNISAFLGPLYGEPDGVDIRVPNDIGSEASALVLEKPWPPLWIVLAALAAALLIIEWCLYQRRWTS